MKQVNTKYYAEQVAQRYPDLPPDQIMQVCLHLMKQLYMGVAVRRYDVAIRDTPRNLKIKIYRRQFDVPQANKVARIRARRLRQQRAARALRVQNKKNPR